MTKKTSIKLTINADVETFIQETDLKRIVKNFATKLYNEKGVRLPNLQVEKDGTLAEDQAVLYINEKVFKKGKTSRVKNLIKQVEQKIYEFVTPEAVDDLLQTLAKEHDYVKREMQNKRIDLMVIHRILLSLVKEGVTIAPFKKIFDAILYHFDRKKELDEVVFGIRVDLVDEILSPYVNPDGYVDGLSLRKIEERVETYAYGGEFHLTTSGEQEREIVDQIKMVLKELSKEGIEPVIVVNYFATRAAFARMFAAYGIKVPVLTSHEANIRNVEYKGIRYIGEFESEELPTSDEKEKIREKMLNLALDLNDKALFKKIASDDWEKYL